MAEQKILLLLLKHTPLDASSLWLGHKNSSLEVFSASFSRGFHNFIVIEKDEYELFLRDFISDVIFFRSMSCLQEKGQNTSRYQPARPAKPAWSLVAASCLATHTSQRIRPLGIK